MTLLNNNTTITTTPQPTMATNITAGVNSQPTFSDISTWSPVQNLHIPLADKQKNRSADIEASIKQVRGLDYIPWSVAADLLSNYNDNLEVSFEVDPTNGQPFFAVPGRGVYLKPFLYDRSTGRRTPATVFPVRNMRMQADENADMVLIGNQMQRAYAKCIAKETGIGWSLYSKLSDESIPTESNNIQTTNRKYEEPQQRTAKSKQVASADEFDF